MQTALDWLETSSAAWWFLLVVYVVALADSVVPVVPSETVVILAGIAAGGGHHALWAVIAAASLGAFCGDTTAYVIGRGAGGRLQRRWTNRPKSLARLDWARTQIAQRGGLMLITARYIPGGRTAITLTCGITRQKWSWFLPFAAAAGVLWSVYAASLGYYFGERFADSHVKAFMAAFTAALSVTALIEGIRWLRHRRRRGGR